MNTKWQANILRIVWKRFYCSPLITEGMLYSIPSLKKHFIYRIIPVELFSSKIQLIVVISFIQRYIPCPFVDTGGRNGFCNGNVSITTFGKTVTDYVAVPSLVVAP